MQIDGHQERSRRRVAKGQSDPPLELPDVLPKTVCCLPILLACLGASCERAQDDDEPDYPLPKLVAHRGGTADRPENTLVAIESALRQRADMIWLSVQTSLDGVPVLYRPSDLSALTNGSGKVADFSAATLATLNAGWSFAETGSDGVKRYPYRDSPVGIPTLSRHCVPSRPTCRSSST
jgi:glycerophosphoryl diester phosphodiesterase